jgi:hypothetical protein
MRHECACFEYGKGRRPSQPIAGTFQSATICSCFRDSPFSGAAVRQPRLRRPAGIRGHRYPPAVCHAPVFSSACTSASSGTRGARVPAPLRVCICVATNYSRPRTSCLTRSRAARRRSSTDSPCARSTTASDRHVIGITADYLVDVRRDVLDQEDGPMLSHGLRDFHGQRLRLTI